MHDIVCFTLVKSLNEREECQNFANMVISDRHYKRYVTLPRNSLIMQIIWEIVWANVYMLYLENMGVKLNEFEELQNNK